MTDSTVRAKFGLGKVSVRLFLFSDPSERAEEGCGRSGRSQLGVFKGRIRFRDEERFTEIDVTRARGAIARDSDQGCRARSMQWWVAAKEASAGAERLEIEAVGLGRGIVTFRAGRNAFKFIWWLPIDLSGFFATGVPYSAATLERGEGIVIHRVVAAKGPPSGVTRDLEDDYDRDPAAALLRHRDLAEVQAPEKLAWLVTGRSSG